jgi:hypothetical protein
MNTLYIESEIQKDDIIASKQRAQEQHPHMLTCAVGYDDNHFHFPHPVSGKNRMKKYKILLT